MRIKTCVFIFSIFLVFYSFASTYASTAYSGENPNLYCDGLDGEKILVGVKELVTCETDPDTEENVIVKYCYYGEDDKATWSQQHAETDPEGC